MDKMQKLSQVKSRIDKNYYYAKRLEKLIKFQKSDWEKLRLVSYIGRIYSQFVTGIYSSWELETEIIRIGQKIEFFPTRKPAEGQSLHVMTKALWTGGHTVIVNNWIKLDKSTRYSIAFTDMNYLDVPDFLKESVAESGGKILCIHEEDYISKAKHLLELSQDYERIILHIGMDDVVPVLAYCNPNWRMPVYFYNHADFRFSFGFSIADKVLNLYKYDMKKTVRYRGVEKENSTVLQFPGNGQIVVGKERSGKKNMRETVSELYGVEPDAKLIVSMGGDVKYESIIGFDFCTFVVELLRKCNDNVNFLIIGADKKKERWKQLESETNGKAKALGSLPREKAEELIGAADLYIVSFPMEAFGATVAEIKGVPYLALLLIDRVTEIYGDGSCRTIAELINKSLDVLNGNVEKYLGHIAQSTLSEETWCKKWKQICASETGHQIHTFKPNRFVKRQEYINCQLLQNAAVTNMRNYRNNTLLLDIHTRIVIDILGKMYSMELDSLGNYKSGLSEIRFRQYMQAMQWLQLKLEGKKIEEYLLACNYHMIAVYGMSYMGKCLVRELENSSITVKYGIDRGMPLHSDIKLFRPEDELEMVDAVIVTTAVDSGQIRKMLAEKGFYKVVLLTDMLDEMQWNSDCKIAE